MAEAGFDMQACLAGLRRQDERAAADFVRELYPLVLKLVRSHLPRRAAEEDLCQIVFIKILSNIGQYSGKVPIEHWVSRIAINTCLNALKAESVRPELRWSDLSEEQATVLDAVTATVGELDPAHGRASRDMVETLLGGLNAPDRLLITMLHLEGYSMDDIRQATGWNIATIKVRAFSRPRKIEEAFPRPDKPGKIMNDKNQPLDRLLRAAGEYHPAMGVEEPPFGFTTRVTAGWLSGAKSGRDGARLEALWFRRAFYGALAVTALSVGWSFKADPTAAAPGDEMAIANYDTTGADLP